MSPLKKVFITCPYFLPAYKAGGPIQSIANLCRHLQGEYEFFIVCSDTDHGGEPLTTVKSDAWNDFEGGTARVYYISARNRKKKTVFKLLKQVKPDCIFINGIYSPVFNIAPLLYPDCKRIIFTRGMLHPGALSQKSLKKKLFISLLKLMQLHKSVTFNASDEEEKQHIRNVFGKKANITIAQNIPNRGVVPQCVPKHDGELKLTSIALISPMKNHALVLEALKSVKANVQYDIYGPIKDEVYWNKCLKIISSLPQNITVTYKGSVEPGKVPQVLAGYHCFILPSKSENFGHAIYEALCSGLPAITSYFTPWNELEKHTAGWNVDVADIVSVTATIEKAALLQQDAFCQYSKGAVAFAEKKVDIDAIKQQYRELFN